MLRAIDENTITEAAIEQMASAPNPRLKRIMEPLVRHLRTVAPLRYMIPMDGPGGDMIRAQKRHAHRPAHIRFIVGAPGYREVVTALYLAGDPHVDSGTVFGVTESLVTNVNEKDPTRRSQLCPASSSTSSSPTLRPRI